jgi:hypothetical protein
MTGRTMRDACALPRAIALVTVPVAGRSSNFQRGLVAPGASMMILMRDPARNTCANWNIPEWNAHSRNYRPSVRLTISSFNRVGVSCDQIAIVRASFPTR